MQVNIDSTGKKDQQVSILYPLGGKEIPKRPSDIKYTTVKDNPIKTQFLLEPKEMKLSGFKAPVNGVVTLQNKYGVSAHIEWDAENIMYYKAIIPFSTFYKDALAPADSARIFNFSIIVNALNLPSDNVKGASRNNDGQQGVNMANGDMRNNGAMNNNMGINNRNNSPYNNSAEGNDVLQGGNGNRQPNNAFYDKNSIKIKIKMLVK